MPERELVSEIDTSSIDAFLCSAGKAGIKSMVKNANRMGGTNASLAALLVWGPKIRVSNRYLQLVCVSLIWTYLLILADRSWNMN